MYRVPARYEIAPYTVFFRTRGRFLSHDSVGTTLAGTMNLEDELGLSEDFYGLAGGPAHCYAWSFGQTPMLKRTHAGSKLRITFKLHRTATQVRHATLRNVPRGTPDSPWYRAGAVERELEHIGCGAPAPGR